MVEGQGLRHDGDHDRHAWWHDTGGDGWWDPWRDPHRTTGGTTTSCVGAAHGEVTATGMCPSGCVGDLYIGVFTSDPRANPGQAPVAATVLYAVDPSVTPAAWAIPNIPCGSLFVAPFLDLDGSIDASSGDLVMTTAATQVTITDGGDIEVDQALDFAIP